MDCDRFRKSAIGDLVPITVHDARYPDEPFHHFAYVPRPLSPSIPLAEATWNSITEASLALGRLDAATAQLPNPYLLVRPAIRKEAVSTSALEGTYTALTDILESEFLEDDDLPQDVVEVRNYVRAAEQALEAIKTRAIATNLIAELQAVLVKGTRGDSYEAGRVRERQVWIGPKRCKVTESHFVPPPPGETLLDGLRDWEKWIHGDHATNLLVRIAIGHYQFETLHPFNDGNGRLGRLIAILQLVDAGALRHPVLYISPYLEVRKGEYQEHLRSVSATGEYDPWVVFFSEALRVQAEDALTRTERLLTERDRMTAALRTEGARGVSIPIAEALIGYPVITPTAAAAQHGVSYVSANKAIKKLVALGILREVTGRSYARMFLAPRIVSILDS